MPTLNTFAPIVNHSVCKWIGALFHIDAKTNAAEMKLMLILKIGMTGPKAFLPKKMRKKDNSGKATAANASKLKVLSENFTSSINLSGCRFLQD